MQNDIEKIAAHYGYEPQSRQLIEEMAELTQAINKVWRMEQKDRLSITESITLDAYKENVVEEIADVQIVLWQMLYLLGAQGKVEPIIEQKIDRQLERIEEERRLLKNEN